MTIPRFDRDLSNRAISSLEMNCWTASGVNRCHHKQLVGQGSAMTLPTCTQDARLRLQ